MDRDLRPLSNCKPREEFGCTSSMEKQNGARDMFAQIAAAHAQDGRGNEACLANISTIKESKVSVNSKRRTRCRPTCEVDLFCCAGGGTLASYPR
jgi:hypothetical protein